MMKSQSIRFIILISCLSLVLSAALIYWVLNSSKKTDTSAAVENDVAKVQEERPPADKTEARLFFLSPAKGEIEIENRNIEKQTGPESLIATIISELASGSKTGLITPVPGDLTVRAVFIDDSGTVYLDFPSSALSGSFPSIETEIEFVQVIFASIRANLRGMKRVQFLLDGTVADRLGHYLDISRPIVIEDFLNQVL